MNGKPWSEEDIATLRRLYADTRTADIAALMGRELTSTYAKAKVLRLAKSEAFKASVKSGRIQRGNTDPAILATRFKPEHTPWNKGLNVVMGGRSAETRFKKGQRPHTWLPIGSYRVGTDGTLEQKVTDLPGAPHLRWHPVARLVWIAANGPVPAGHMVKFRPGMHTVVLEEITLERLECISRKENIARNHWMNKHPVLAALIPIKSHISRQVNRIARETKDQTKELADDNR